MFSPLLGVSGARRLDGWAKTTALTTALQGPIRPTLPQRLGPLVHRRDDRLYGTALVPQGGERFS